ncbi:MAG: hypothetical protein IKN43_11765 [Selenomonadaceae bacterium]|nr:hypothetical protein [Selenomonadaceae bacterium]
MYYRTRTYIAGDWDGDSDVIEQIHKWNEGDRWSLSFSDAHDLMQARDPSLNCSIKKSLSERLNASKRFVLIVGSGTNSRRAGMCRYCKQDSNCQYKSNWHENLSFIEYECYRAYKLYSEGKIDVVVLYNATICDKKRCPPTLREIGTHVAMKEYVNYRTQWSYEAVKKALQN